MADEIRIEKVFEAPVQAVWDAWTQPDMVKKWWGPEGFSAPSAMVDLRVGGKYVFAMHGPEGSEWDRDMYSAGVFKEIVPLQKIVASDYFSDKDGNKIEPSAEGQSADFPTEMNTTVLFEDLGNGRTRLSIVYPKPENEAQFEAMLKSGMKEGWMSSLDKMEKALQS